MTSPDLSSVPLPPLPSVPITLNDDPRMEGFTRLQDWAIAYARLAVAEATKVPLTGGRARMKTLHDTAERLRHENDELRAQLAEATKVPTFRVPVLNGLKGHRHVVAWATVDEEDYLDMLCWQWSLR